MAANASLALDKWRAKSEQAKFDEECNIQAEFVPAHVATCRNFLFSINESDKAESLYIFDITSAGKIELKNTFKMGLSNCRGIAANPDYFAFTYSDVKRWAIFGNFLIENNRSLFNTRIADCVKITFTCIVTGLRPLY